MSEEWHQKAKALGLDRLTDEHLAEFQRATEGMQRHRERLPGDPPIAAEPAHIFRAKDSAS
jgi:hypothetical protein